MQYGFLRSSPNAPNIKGFSPFLLEHFPIYDYLYIVIGVKSYELKKVYHLWGPLSLDGVEPV